MRKGQEENPRAGLSAPPPNPGGQEAEDAAVYKHGMVRDASACQKKPILRRYQRTNIFEKMKEVGLCKIEISGVGKEEQKVKEVALHTTRHI